MPSMPALTMPMVMPFLDGVVEENGVDRLAHRVVAAEGERDVGDAAGNARAAGSARSSGGRLGKSTA